MDLDDLDETMDEPIVNMLRMVKVEETYDMTYSDSDDDWLLCTECGDVCNAYFMDYANDTMNVAVGLKVNGGSRPLVDGGAYIRGVRLEDDIPIVLDSGADMLVLPMKYKDIGLALSKTSVLRDAHGNQMAGGALRQAVVELVDDEGNKACIKETFALSNVIDPLLALGKMLRRVGKLLDKLEKFILAMATSTRSSSAETTPW